MKKCTICGKKSGNVISIDYPKEEIWCMDCQSKWEERAKDNFEKHDLSVANENTEK